MPSVTLRRAPWRTALTPLFDRDRDAFGNGLRRMFDSMAEPPFAMEPIGLMPAVEISETDDEFLCSTELPGMKLKDVTVTFDDGVLTIKGEKREDREQKDKRMHLVERSFGTFERSFTFPGKVEADKVAATFSDGVLTVRMPKAAEARAHTRTIPVVAK